MLNTHPKCRERSWGGKHKIDQYITPSLIPRFSTSPDFDHLQYAQTEGEDLVIHGMSGVDPHSHLHNVVQWKTIHGVMKSQYCVTYLT